MPTTASSVEWARIVNTTIREYLKVEEVAVIRRRILLAMLKQKGRISYNKSGDGIQWPVRYRRAKMTTNNGQQNLSFQGENRWQDAYLDYAGYAVTDAMTKREKLKNRGPQAIINVFGRMIPLLMEDIEDQFSEEIYVDSAATGNSSRMSGIETMLELNGTVNITSGAQRTANAADVVGFPWATYATLSTQLGYYGGTWGEGTAQTTIGTTWPSSRGDAEYDFFSPTVVNYTSSAFTGTSWSANAVDATRFMIEKMKAHAKVAIPLVLMDNDLYRIFKKNNDQYQRINVENTGLRKMGVGDSFYQDGAEITSEYGIPPAVGYGFTVEEMELLSMQAGIFEAEGPEYDMATRSWRVAVDCIGQFKFRSPRNFGALKTLA